MCSGHVLALVLYVSVAVPYISLLPDSVFYISCMALLVLVNIRVLSVERLQ